ncbi:HTH domain-containing protein [Aquitalea pelogenes]|uniref:HTH domain-containing protein n=1 Tax=Aquitalea pelogenes TaxID=1293573 RepID=UPI0035AFDB57
MVEVLKKKKKALSLGEVVTEIEKMEPCAFRGQTPTNSLYSIIYRRERRRVENGGEPLFLIEKDRNYSVYLLNPKFKNAS